MLSKVTRYLVVSEHAVQYHLHCLDFLVISVFSVCWVSSLRMENTFISSLELQFSAFKTLKFLSVSTQIAESAK